MSDAYYLTEKHRALRQEVREFAEKRIAPHVPRMEASAAVEHDLVREIARRGWIAVTVAPRYGGIGAGHLARMLVVEEISRVSAAMGAATQASQLGVAKIMRYGTSQQKHRWLPKVASGECLPTIAVTEPGSGSHVLGMEATARRTGKHYVLNGSKVFVGNSHIGDVHGVVARTAEGSKGLTAFLVEADRSGLTIVEHPTTLGLRGFSFGELRLDNCRIPAGNRIGAEGQGRDVAYSSSILYGRPNLAAVALGLHQAVMDTTVNLCRERTRYGAPLHELDTVRDKVGRMQSALMTARLTAYHAAALLDRQRCRITHPCDDALMNAKLVGVELLLDSARLAMEIHGAAALTPGRPMERYWRDAQCLFAPAGTSDIQRLRLAAYALGLDDRHYSAPSHPPPA
ncbi:acyl-CoA/acyl-ACP dehydrogenase [Streptomyces sp. PTM05]|uniref:Acyl-CoA/acyl-ACP dehydrogenase n=1 Tax=Streptantibioticus parmotrematis TaxID=2873249 RepID=A0ABS7QZS8_9ACTN|nr:acyl-CoA dehydrogenase family protein [Streptantibioticus parmotrematis]MBY8887279.1 acyl-CoA/acyl-ACP dehydrogenase [Streptantibioticus parmotrematis]